MLILELIYKISYCPHLSVNFIGLVRSISYLSTSLLTNPQYPTSLVVSYESEMFKSLSYNMIYETLALRKSKKEKLANK